MLLSLPLLLCFFQSPNLYSVSPHNEEAWAREAIKRQTEQGISSDFKENERRVAAIEEQQFVSKFNKLMKSLLDFADHYNTGHTVDLKSVQRVKKAWRDLEKTDGWFKPEPGRTDVSQSK